MALPAGSATLHSAGLVLEQAPDPTFWVHFGTHNVNANPPAETAEKKQKKALSGP